MNSPPFQKEPEVLVERYRHMVITLNRPGAINALITEMIRLIRQALEEALAEDRFQFILIQGAGSRGFCAEGDVKRLAKAVRDKDFGRAKRFFQEEYALDLLIHRYPRPIIVIADGITVGGGLGLSAGADIVVATGDLKTFLTPFLSKDIPSNPKMDAWVEAHFSGKFSMQGIMTSLSQCSSKDPLCNDTYRRLWECSPSSLVLTLGLLHRNEGRPLEEVFAVEARAAGFMIRRPDYFEGIRARLLEKDSYPRWQPSTIKEVSSDELFTFLKTMNIVESTGRVALSPGMQNSRKEMN